MANNIVENLLSPKNGVHNNTSPSQRNSIDRQSDSCDSSSSSQFTSRVIDKQNQEVEMILDRKISERKGLLYLVKWKGYSMKYATWERRVRLFNCEKLLYYFDMVRDPPLELSRKMLRYFIYDISSRNDVITLRKLCSMIYNVSEDYIVSMDLTFSDLVKAVSRFLEKPPEKLNKFRSQLLSLMQYAEARKHVLLSLREFEEKINKMTNPPVTLENDVDMEDPPKNFRLILDYINPFADPSEIPIHCKCNNCYKNRNSCCASNFPDAAFAYTHYKRLQLLKGYPIFECNYLCKCSSDCPNRVVQRGSKVHLCIFRTPDGRGWGLKTLDFIEKDQFVIEYLGEVVTSEEAERRGKLYDFIGLSYLFDLDYEEHCKYTVDGGVYGNISRFINHSCSPNMQVFTVWINSRNLDIPRLAFFTTRQIFPGEELTFDYKMVDSRTKKGIVIPDEDRMLCRCNAKNCRKYLF